MAIYCTRVPKVPHPFKRNEKGCLWIKWVHFFPQQTSPFWLVKHQMFSKDSLTSYHLPFQKDWAILLSEVSAFPTSIYPSGNATTSLLILLVCFPKPRPCCTIPKRIFPGIKQCIYRCFLPRNYVLWHTESIQLLV